MQTQTSFLDELKSMYQRNTFMKLIFINVGVFLIINILNVFGRLGDFGGSAGFIISKVFAMPTSLSDFIVQPWTLFTTMFAHIGFMHVLLNMLMLFFIGRIFEQVYSGKRLLYTYLLGGVAGGLFEILAHLVFPALYGTQSTVVGASGAVMALFVLLAFSQPQLKVNMLFLPPIRLIWFALIYIAVDFLRLGSQDGVAHFAHLGGAIIGLLGAQNLHSSSNIITATQNGVESFLNLFSGKKRAPKLKVKRGRDVRQMTDEEYNADAKVRQEQIDRILDKISKSGYESLSKKEKDFLFNQSKNG